ncbi:hypothetical protein [Streptomyces kaempferi]|uniref:Uncharacterized protein n=1 Tax=Streptomyces kaempferi TaxID=333725 RepID=A0ABW3XNB5_9ACTN
MAVVTSKGREIIFNRLKGSGSEPLNLGWGNNPNSLTENVSDVALFKEASESRVTGTSSLVTTTTPSDTYQVTGTFTSAGAQTIAEVALSDSASKPFSSTWSTAPTGTSGTSATLGASYTPANGTYIQCRGEVMQVTAGTGTTSLTLVRGANNSTAVSQSNADTVTAGNIPGVSTVTNGSLLFHSAHGAQVLATSDQVAYTLKVQLT